LETYRLLTELNRKEIYGEAVSDTEKEQAVSVFLGGVCSGEEIRNYKKRMRVQPDTDNTYPDYFLPPRCGNKKLRLIQGYLPKTNILYANHYELEILRLLYRFAPENETVLQMVQNTRQRVDKTCFGNSCMQGECFAAGISVLRFLAAVCPEDAERINRLLDPLGEAFLSFGGGQAAVQQGIPLSYLLMAFTDLRNDKTEELIRQKKDWLLTLLGRGWITGTLSNGKVSEGDTYNLLGKYILRNAIGILPECRDAASYEIYISDTDGRCYCRIP